MIYWPAEILQLYEGEKKHLSQGSKYLVRRGM